MENKATEVLEELKEENSFEKRVDRAMSSQTNGGTSK